MKWKEKQHGDEMFQGMTAKQLKNWDLIVSYMHMEGDKIYELSQSEFLEVYSLANGNKKEPKGYDWDHIKNSSDDAKRKMANKIRKIIK